MRQSTQATTTEGHFTMAYTSLPQGAHLVQNGVEYTVWAPERKSVDVLVVTTGGAIARKIPMVRRDEGYFSATDPLGEAGDRYLLCLDNEATFPPPVSRYQPEGVHGPGEVIDPRRTSGRMPPGRDPPFAIS